MANNQAAKNGRRTARTKSVGAEVSKKPSKSGPKRAKPKKTAKTGAQASKPEKDAPKRKTKTSTGKSNGKPSRKTSVEMERLLRRKPEVTSYDTYGYAVEAEEDYFVAPEKGRVYGRCGGRTIRSLMEKRICDMLSRLGVAHSHRPRRYEVRIEDGQIAAYSPCIVLRGRGREGKTAIIETLATLDLAHVGKIEAFRALYETEFYVILVAPGAVFDDMTKAAYDEAVLPSEVGSLVARLAE